MIYLGPVDFKVGGTPPNNLLVLSFVKEGNRWKYDSADYMNLASIPEVRKQLEMGKLDHLKGPEFSPKGTIDQPGSASWGRQIYRQDLRVLSGTRGEDDGEWHQPASVSEYQGFRGGYRRRERWVK